MVNRGIWFGKQGALVLSIRKLRRSILINKCLKTHNVASTLHRLCKSETMYLLQNTNFSQLKECTQFITAKFPFRGFVLITLGPFLPGQEMYSVHFLFFEIMFTFKATKA